MSSVNRLTVFSGNANRQLSQDICHYLEIPLGDATVDRFSEGEIHVKINQDVRGRDVFVVQPTSSPLPNDYLMELLIMMDALRRASARRITAVVPYFGYARQDRKDQPRVPITAKLVANLITTAGAGRVLTIDLHAGQIQGFFDIPLDHLLAVNIFTQYFTPMKLENLVVVSPDVGGVKMARAYAKRLNASLAVVDKRRINDSKTEVMNIMGEVKGKNVVVVDDVIATGSSVLEAVQALKKEGAKEIYAAITHPVLSDNSVEKIKKSFLTKLVVTDTIYLDPQKRSDKIDILSVADLLGEAIRRIHNEESVSSLFD